MEFNVTMKYDVIKQKEQYFFQKETEDKVYLQSGVEYTNFNIKGCSFIEERENLDYSLLENIDVFVFERVEEYTKALADLILCRFPDKKVTFLDENATLFWHKSRVFYVADERLVVEDNQGTKMYIYSDVGEDKESGSVGEYSLIYNSLQVMQSLCWCRKRVSLGEKNADKTILLIEFSGKNAGMGDIVISVQQYIRLARQRGWYPVVYLTEENQYISCEGDNMWDYFFEQPSGISVEEALQSKCVIRGSENNFGVLPWVANPLCNMNEALKEKVYFNEKMLKLFLRTMPEQLMHPYKVLGVIARGSDLAKCTHLKINIKKMIEEVKNTFKKGYEYIFLATEDKEYQELFYEEFGERLLFIPQKRISHDYEKEEYKYVADLLKIEKEERADWGSKYLLITYCLSKCDALLYSIPCGALRLANLWRDKPYDMLRCTFQAVSALEIKKQKNIIHIYECESFLRNPALVVVYGLGDVAEMIYPILDNYRDKIIACDKRAAFEAYEFHGIKVVAPENLVLLDGDAKILITSPRCGQEIRIELEQMGIAKDRIVQLDY